MTKAKGWAPWPGPQIDAIDTEAFETLYGGAAGGGKSDLLLGLARTRHRSSLLLRRTYPELEDSLILRSREIYGDQSHYNASKHVWSWRDCRIRFGHLEYDKAVQTYQSAQFDLIGFDELTQFTNFQYEYMLSRARTTDRTQRVRVIGCTNPGSGGNDWVMERWAPWLRDDYPNPAEPGELRWFKRLQDGRDVETEADDPDGVSRTFIPARLKDNPFLGEDYRRRLQLLPEPYRSQLLNGDWQAGQVDDAYQVIPTAWIKAAMARWSEDGRPPLGGLKPMVGVDVARGGDDQTVLALRYGNWYGRLQKHAGRTTPDGQSVAALIALALADGGQANVDVIGVGASAYDIARMQGLSVEPVNFAAGSDKTDKSGQLGFLNKRAECYWGMREALDPDGGQHVALPPDSELLGDLKAPRWSMQAKGVKVEKKDDIKGRLGRSPDCGDAVVIAQAQGTSKKHGPLPGRVFLGVKWGGG